MSRKGGITVRAKNSKVFQSIVIMYTVNVIKNK